MATLTETPRLRRVIRAQRFNFEESLEQETFLNDSNNNETPQRKRITTPRDLLYDCDNFNFSFEQQVSLENLMAMKPESVEYLKNDDSCYVSHSSDEQSSSYSDSDRMSLNLKDLNSELQNAECDSEHLNSEPLTLEDLRCSQHAMDLKSCKSHKHVNFLSRSNLSHNNLSHTLSRNNSRSTETLSMRSSSSTESSIDWQDDYSTVLGIEYYESEYDDLSSLNTSACSSTKQENKSLLEVCMQLDPEHKLPCCGEHPSAPLMLYCEPCGTPMCLLCKLDLHAKHKFTTLKAAAGMCQRKLRHNQRRMARKITETEGQISQMQQYQTDMNKQRLLVEEKLRQQRDHLHDKINLEYDKLMMQVDSVWGQEMMFMDTKVAEIRKQLNDYRDDLQRTQELLQSCSDTSHLQLVTECKDLVLVGHRRERNPIKKASYEYLDLMTPTRPQSSESVDNVEELFHRQYFILGQGADITTQHLGTFNTGFIPSQSMRNCLVSCGKVLLSFTTRGIQNVTHMATGISVTKDHNLLVTDLGLDTVRTFDLQGHRKLALNTLPFDEPSSGVMLQDGSYLVACKNGLKLFKSNGEFDRKVETDAESPQGLAVNHGGDVIVTDQQSSSLLHILARADFRSLHTIIGGSRAPLFRQVWYCAVDKDNNIVISDTSDHTVKVLSSIGMLLFEFGGKGCQSGQFFYPAGVCVDSYGHILVADLCNNRVQMFSKTGEFLAVILSAENDLESPIDLDIDPKGNLVVLQGNGDVKIVQYIY